MIGRKTPTEERRCISHISYQRPLGVHGLPWNYKDWFAQRGLNVNNPEFEAWVRGGGGGGHQSWSSAYDDVWNRFLRNNQNASPKQVRRFYNNIRGDSRLGGGF